MMMIAPFHNLFHSAQCMDLLIISPDAKSSTCLAIRFTITLLFIHILFIIIIVAVEIACSYTKLNGSLYFYILYTEYADFIFVLFNKANVYM